MKNTAICTISSHNYMAYGLTSLLSAKKFNDNCDFFYLIADNFDEKLYRDYQNQIQFINLYKIGINDDDIINMAFKYNIVEFNTAVKPAFYNYLFTLGYDSVIYLDPDTECYSSFDSFLRKNSDKSIIVTPHKTSSIESEFIKDRSFLNNGIYNLGFIALNKSKSTTEFLNWWDDKLRNQCFIDYSIGLATDQIWVELASTIFDGFYVEKNIGLNVAFWNIHERRINHKNSKWYANNDELVFFHFSSLSATCDSSFLNNIDTINPGFISFYNQHIKNVKNNNIEKFGAINYAFENYSNGKPITKGERLFYGFSTTLQDIYKNPFEINGDSFYKKVISKHKIFKKDLNKEEKCISILVHLFGVNRTIKILSRLSTQGIRRLALLFEIGLEEC